MPWQVVVLVGKNVTTKVTRIIAFLSALVGLNIICNTNVWT
jgi:hypothetical protein